MSKRLNTLCALFSACSFCWQIDQITTHLDLKGSQVASFGQDQRVIAKVAHLLFVFRFVEIKISFQILISFKGSLHVIRFIGNVHANFLLDCKVAK